MHVSAWVALRRSVMPGMDRSLQWQAGARAQRGSRAAARHSALHLLLVWQLGMANFLCL